MIKLIKQAVMPVLTIISLLIECVSNTPEFETLKSSVPWLYFAAAFLGISVLQICYNLGEAKEKTAKLFEVQHFVPASKVYNHNEYLELTVKIKFLKTIKKSNVQLLIYTGASLNNIKKYHSVSLATNQEYLTDQEHSFVIGTISESQSISDVWGKYDDPTAKNLLGSSKNIVKLRVTSGRKRQEHRFFIERFSASGGTKGLCFLLSEQDDLWESKD